MLGKASEIKTQEIWHDGVEDWLESNSNLDIIDIKFAIHPNGRGVSLIIYKEAESNGSSTTP